MLTDRQCEELVLWANHQVRDVLPLVDGLYAEVVDRLPDGMVRVVVDKTTTPGQPGRGTRELRLHPEDFKSLQEWGRSLDDWRF